MLADRATSAKGFRRLKAYKQLPVLKRALLPHQSKHIDRSLSLDRSTERSILVQRQMRSRLIIITGICGQDPLQMPRPEDNNVIQAVAPKRSDQAFRVWVLPGRSW